MDKYDPANPIGSDEWLALNEAKQIELVRDFHAELDLEMPDDALSIHSSIHVIVENQLAMRVELKPETIAKLTRQGLNRHEAIHAIGAILSEDIFDLLKGNIEEFSPTKYRRKLEKITAKRWLKGKY
jgi:mRNA degradation ribonuclease J1/J2